MKIIDGLLMFLFQNLMTFLENNRWAFDVFISEFDDIPNYSKFIIDINYEYEFKNYVAMLFK